jgi:transposase-like protein
MGMARYLVEAHLREGRSVAELAASHGVHRSWIYKLLARYRAGGDAGLEPRSRRPRRSPTKAAEGTVTLRYRSHLHHIGLGRVHKGRRVLVLVADRDVRVLTVEGEILRQLTLDPSRDYHQPLG